MMSVICHSVYWHQSQEYGTLVNVDCWCDIKDTLAATCFEVLYDRLDLNRNRKPFH